MEHLSDGKDLISFVEDHSNNQMFSAADIMRLRCLL